MYWPLEESASTMPTSVTNGGSEVEDESEVAINKNKYSGRITANLYYNKHPCYIFYIYIIYIAYMKQNRYWRIGKPVCFWNMGSTFFMLILQNHLKRKKQTKNTENKQEIKNRNLKSNKKKSKGAELLYLILPTFKNNTNSDLYS